MADCSSVVGRLPSGTRPTSARLGALFLVTVGVACTPDPVPSTYPTRQQLATILGGERPFEASVLVESPAACVLALESGPGRCLPTGGGSNAPSLASLAEQVAAILRTDPSAVDASWSAAIIDIASPFVQATALDRSIELLDDLLDRTGRPAAMLVDASAARFVRAVMFDRASDLLASLELADEAVRVGPELLLAHLNLAVVLERLHLVRQALTTWQRVERTVTNPSIRAEARSHVERLSGIVGRGSPQSFLERAFRDGAADRNRMVDSLVAVDPGWVRTELLEGILPTWSGQAGDAAATTAAAIRSVAKALAANGDSLGLRIVPLLTMFQSRALRLGLTSIGQGVMAYRSDRFGDSGRFFRLASEHLRNAGRGASAEGQNGVTVLKAWVDQRVAQLATFEGQYREADSLHAAALRTGVRQGLGALIGHARWGRANAAVRRGDLGLGLEEYRAAATVFRNLDPVAHATLQAQIAATLSLIGRDDLATNQAVSAMASLHPHRHRYWLNLALQEWSYSVEGMGFARAATWIQREAVVIAETAGSPLDRGEAASRLARLLAAAGDYPGTDSALGVARPAIAGIPDATMGARLRADLAQSEGMRRQSEPLIAVAELTKAVDFFRSVGAGPNLSMALRQRATASLGAADTSQAEADFSDVVSVTDQFLRNRPTPMAASILARSRSEVYRQLVALRLARGDTLGAFRDLGKAFGDRNSASRLTELPPGVAQLAYTVLSDRVLLWLRTDTRLQVRETPVAESRLAGLVQRYQATLRSETDSVLVSRLGAELHEILISPVKGALAATQTLIVLSDGPLNGVPFASLQDRRSNRYLVEDFDITHQQAFSGFQVDEGPLGGGVPQVVLVDASAFDREAFPELAELRFVGAEISAIQALYRRARVVAPEGRAEMIAALGAGDIVHVAAHARSVDELGYQSFLVSAGDPASAIVTGRDILDAELTRPKLVVLSACGTIPRGRTIDGIGGIPGALIGAGVNSVISSMWELDDRAAADLMVLLHEALGELPPSKALRRVQLELLRGADPRLRHPRTWAAFRIDRGNH